MNLSTLTSKGFVKVGIINSNITKSLINPNYDAFCLFAFLIDNDVMYMGYLMTKEYKLDFKIDFILSCLGKDCPYGRLANKIKNAGVNVDIYALKSSKPVSTRKLASALKNKYKDNERFPWDGR